MTQDDGNRRTQSALVLEEQPQPIAPVQTIESDTAAQVEPATRSKLRARQEIRQNRFVIVTAGGLVFALMIFALVSAHRGSVSPGSIGQKAASNIRKGNPDQQGQAANLPGEKSIFPIVDSGRPVPNEMHEGYVSEQDLQRSATRKTASTAPVLRPPSGNTAGTLGAIPPFGEQPWQAPPYQPGMTPSVASANSGQDKTDREAWDKASLVFVRKVSSTAAPVRQQEQTPAPAEYGLGLPIGTRLRARLESAASTAVRTPVLAVIEYNYERDGEIVIPAGTKAVGQIQEADRSGYMRIQFDSLLLPDGGTVPIHAAATDLEMRPVKGKVEGKNTGKNVLVRSLSGLGQASTMLLGRGSLNAPLSESDLIRERISNNIGEASDEQISRLAITARIVVTVSAGTDIYVVLEKTTQPVETSSAPGTQARGANPENLDQLRQLLQLQQELNQAGTK